MICWFQAHVMILTPAKTTQTCLLLLSDCKFQSHSSVKDVCFYYQFHSPSFTIYTINSYIILCKDISNILYSIRQNHPVRFQDLMCFMASGILHMTQTQHCNRQKSPKHSLNSEPEATRGPSVSDQSISNNKILNVFLTERPQSLQEACVRIHQTQASFLRGEG